MRRKVIISFPFLSKYGYADVVIITMNSTLKEELRTQETMK